MYELRPKAIEWVKLFDPQAIRSCSKQTRSASDYHKVSLPAFLTAAIFTSLTISKKQKIRFLLGVFVENDSGTFRMIEFMSL